MRIGNVVLVAASFRSFVLRKGRLTKAQARALAELWPRFGIENHNAPVDPAQLFGREAQLVIEIGFGNGEATWRMARDESEKNFIGIEVHKPGVGHLLQALDAQELDNVRIARSDAVHFIRDSLPERGGFWKWKLHCHPESFAGRTRDLGKRRDAHPRCPDAVGDSRRSRSFVLPPKDSA